MSQANRLKLKKSRELQSKQKYKHGETKKTGSAKRGYKTLYWNQKTGSWQSTKPTPIVRKVEVETEKPKTRAEKLKDGMATWNTKKGNEAIGTELKGSKMVKKKENYKPRAEADVIKNKKNKGKTPAYKPRAEAQVIKDKKTNASLKTTKYRRTKEEGIGKGDTRITKKLKKAGFTETRLAKLREKNAAFQKAKKGGKKAMEAYRKKYPKRG